MSIRTTTSSLGEEYVAECDECGDVIADGCIDFREAVEGVKSSGRLVPARKPRWPHRAGGKKWNHYCATCAEELED